MPADPMSKEDARLQVLEAALKKIIEQPESYDDGRSSYAIGYAFRTIKSIARAALSGVTE